MREAFLHYVWQYQYFDWANLLTTDGEKINIINQGLLNSDAGPDFQNAKIIINNVEWYGHVEIHVNSSDWQKHNHSKDTKYNNVILHVVWNDDTPILYQTGNKIPTIELKNRVDENLLLRSNELLEKSTKIACSNVLSHISSITKLTMVERAMVKRLELKATLIDKTLKDNKNDWEETCYQWLGKNMGFKINSQPFFELTTKITSKLLRKYCNNETQMEALLFGAAGFLAVKPSDAYQQLLQTEYNFLQQKHEIQTTLNLAHWKFLRLRPYNFPTIRIAQLVQIIRHQEHLFDFITNFSDQKDILEKLRIKQSKYWQSHFKFGVTSAKAIPGLGTSSIENIIINTSVPLLAARSIIFHEPQFMDKALDLLTKVKAEQNKVIQPWVDAGECIKTAFDSQGYLSLYQLYCEPRRCLQCGVGFSIMGNKHQS